MIRNNTQNSFEIVNEIWEKKLFSRNLEDYVNLQYSILLINA